VAAAALNIQLIIIITQPIPKNKPDILIRDKDDKERTCKLTSGVRNVVEKVAEEILKYQDITQTIQSMWNVTTEVIPVIIVGTGTIQKPPRQYLSNIPERQEIKQLAHSSHIGHCTALCKVLM
jgi:hypothetical protein